jgi:hypothetical protein
MRLRKLIAASAVAAVFSISSLTFLSGCGGGPVATPTTLPVKGVVTYKGVPVKTGRVQFEPDGGRDAYGDIQPDGTYTLTTYTKDDGAIPGTHRVAVTGLGKTVPLKYQSVSSSKIEVEVSEGKTDYPINLN